MVSYLTHWLEVVDTHVHTQNCISMWTKQDDGGSGTSHHDDNGVLDCKAEIRTSLVLTFLTCYHHS